MQQDKTVVAWLKDAYAMESGQVTTLENHRKDAGSKFPQIEAKLGEHLEKTRNHAELIKGCLQRHNEDVSAIKVGLGKAAAAVAGIPTHAARDEIVKIRTAGS